MQDIVLINETCAAHIADKLRALPVDEDLRRRIGRGGRSFVDQHLHWDTVARDYEELLHHLCARPSP
jgi:glycosyltransferase involved in cell wall biosynthesis